MKGLAAVAAVLALACTGGAAIAADPAPKFAPEDAHAGCLHNDLRPCMIALGLVFWFDMKLAASQIAIRNELDVNGQTAHRKIVISAKLPNHNETAVIMLTLGSPTPNDQVIRAELRLPSDLHFAHTPSEYDKTWLYETVSTLFGNKCPGLDRLTLYRFFENSVKPREHVKTEVVKYGIFNHTKQTMDTEKIPLCGFFITTHERAEWEGPPDRPATGRNTEEYYIDLE
jgi:hypothetical protein